MELSDGERKRVDVLDDGVTVEDSTEAKREWSDLLNRVGFGDERVVLTRRGKPVVVVISLRDFERLRSLERASLEGNLPSAAVA